MFRIVNLNYALNNISIIYPFKRTIPIQKEIEQRNLKRFWFQIYLKVSSRTYNQLLIEYLNLLFLTIKHTN